MKLTKTQLKKIIKEELKEGAYAGHYIRGDADVSNDLANAVLDMQEMRGDEYTVKTLRGMADSIERGE